MNKFLVTSAVAGMLICGTTLAESAPAPTAQDPAQTEPAPATSPSPAQSPAAPPAPAQGASRIAPGSVIPVELTKTVDAKKAKTGDEVVAKVTEDMKTGSGQVLVPKDTKVIGHVTGVQARSKEQKESQLAIVFDRAVTKDGNTMQQPMSIQAVIGQQQNNNPNAPGGNEPAAIPSPGGGMPAGGGGGGGRTGSMSSPQASNTTPPPSASAGTPLPDTGSNGSHPAINAQTQGVIGIANLNLSPASGGAPGSVMTSEKSNVKLESGTMLLLKVNP
jgi:hypothetical protein